MKRFNYIMVALILSCFCVSAFATHPLDRPLREAMESRMSPLQRELKSIREDCKAKLDFEEAARIAKEIAIVKHNRHCYPKDHQIGQLLKKEVDFDGCVFRYQLKKENWKMVFIPEAFLDMQALSLLMTYGSWAPKHTTYGHSILRCDDKPNPRRIRYVGFVVEGDFPNGKEEADKVDQLFMKFYVDRATNKHMDAFHLYDLQ